jgi:hypothetical protein
VKIAVNFNDGGPARAEWPLHYVFRSAAAGDGPVPPPSATDLAWGAAVVVVEGRLHPASGPPGKLVDGVGAAGGDDPAGNVFFQPGGGKVRISLAAPAEVGQVNSYSWHHGDGARAAQEYDLYAGTNAVRPEDLGDPGRPGWRLLARVRSTRPGGPAANAGQHGVSITPAAGRSLGRFRHFLFDVRGEPGAGTFYSEIDIVAAEPGPGPARADPLFDGHVAPLLARRCLGCHNPTDRKGRLDLTRPEALTHGRDGGPLVVPGKPDASPLLQRVLAGEMPPRRPLPGEEKALLRGWVAAGATWGSRPLDRFRFTTEARAGYDWWALRELSNPRPPAVKDPSWPRGPLDHFVLARLEENDLWPSPPADHRTLLRRVTFDLTGLPPEPGEVEAFTNDPAPGAYERVVDRLLDSPAYGERWARHWLDVVRFAESQGFERNRFRPHAWKYRDWVIQALNDDMPYDEFVRRQLAGDVLRPDDPGAVVATGFLVTGPHDLLGLTQGTELMRAQAREDEMEGLVGSVGQTFLGLTLHCARCHDHKVDPLSQKEYYQLAAALAGVTPGDRPAAAAGTAALAGQERRALAGAARAAEDEFLRAADPALRPLLAEARARAVREAEQAAARAEEVAEAAEKKARQAPAGAAADNARQVALDRVAEREAARETLAQARGPCSTAGLDDLWDRLPAEARPAFRRLVAETSRLETRDRLLAGGAAHAAVPGPPVYVHVLARGDVLQPGEVVAPRGPAAVRGPPPDFGLAPDAPEAERRRRLAAWVTDPRNPLAPRVLVNRLWHYHFGAGLVETPSDLGFNGGRPSHPELLDWLAGELVRGGWSLKKLHRQILLSATYRQGSRRDAAAAARDGANRLLWRVSPRRLEAEAVRDTVLAVADLLNPRMGGPGYRDVSFEPSGDNMTYAFRDAAGPALHRRSVYRTWVRLGPNPLLEALDCADPTVATPRRAVTTTPLQALALWNNPFMSRAAAAFAGRLRREAGADVARQVERAYRLAYARLPTAGEAASAQSFVAAHGLAELCLVIFNSNEFVCID